MLFWVFLGTVLLALGVFLLCWSLEEEEFLGALLGILVMVAGACFFIGAFLITDNTSTSKEWVLKEEAFLAPISDNSYLLEGDTNYIYQKKSPTGSTEPEMAQKDEHAQIEVKEIASTEEPYVLRYERTVDGEEEYKYVFYIPQS